MREIKFRAWDKEKAKMDKNFRFDEFNDVNDYFADDDFVFMQYTGLKDKNGKEIYEGDILTWGNNIIAKVYYADDLAMFRCSVEGTEEFDLFAFNQEASIIGNIYQNKELLNE
ncbi:YopX family protein [Campylobacter concisus]|uniref:YopX family protein n=1 Tax=Campylobacter concisus TaxID=199 RepID=UPI00122C2B85|nr:YopX family protein [Campylobacter concisus]